MDIVLDAKIDQKYHKVRTQKGEKIKLPIYTANDDISGEVKVELKDTKKYEHLGVKIMLIGFLGKCNLMQKYTAIRTCQQSSTLFRKSLSLLVS